MKIDTQKMDMDVIAGRASINLHFRLMDMAPEDVAGVIGAIMNFFRDMEGGLVPTTPAPVKKVHRFLVTQTNLIRDAPNGKDAWGRFHERWPTSKLTELEVRDRWLQLRTPTVKEPPAEEVKPEGKGERPPKDQPAKPPAASEKGAKPEKKTTKEPNDPDVEAIVKKYQPPKFIRGQIVRPMDLEQRRALGIGEVRKHSGKTGEYLVNFKDKGAEMWCKPDEIELTELEGDVKK